MSPFFTDEKGQVRGPIPSDQGKRWTHTGGVKVEDGTVVKPLVGRIRTGKGHHEFPTNEYDAIKDLQGLPHVPKDVEKVRVDGVPHLRRENYVVLADEDYKSLKRDDLMSIERTVREAHRRGWTIDDDVQLGISRKDCQYVIFDWSNAHRVESTKDVIGDEIYLNKLWRKAGFGNYVEARSWAESERWRERRQTGYALKLNHTYMSMARPPFFLVSDFPEGDKLIRPYDKDEPWKPFGLIHTENPLPEETVRSADLTPTTYEKHG